MVKLSRICLKPQDRFGRALVQEGWCWAVCREGWSRWRFGGRASCAGRKDRVLESQYPLLGQEDRNGPWLSKHCLRRS